MKSRDEIQGHLLHVTFLTFATLLICRRDRVRGCKQCLRFWLFFFLFFSLFSFVLFFYSLLLSFLFVSFLLLFFVSTTYYRIFQFRAKACKRLHKV